MPLDCRNFLAAASSYEKYWCEFYGKMNKFHLFSRLRHKQSEWICIFFSEAGGAGLAIGLDFERDVAPRIHFFVDVGVKPKQLGSLFTRNPGIFITELDSLKTRVNYLKWKKFSNIQVSNDCIPRLKSHLILSAFKNLLTIPYPIPLRLEVNRPQGCTRKRRSRSK